MKLAGVWLVFIALVVSGCASLPETRHARPTPPDEPVVLKQGEVLVFGRLLFTENGQSKVPYGLGKPLWQLESPKPVSESAPPTTKRTILPFLSTDAEGFFAYVIPAGQYEIAHLEPLGYTPLLRPGLEFDAREPGRAYYLGDIEVDFDAWSWLGGLWGNYISRITRVEVVDRFDTTRDALTQRLARDPEHIGKALLTTPPGQSPQLFEPFVPPVIHR